MVERVKSEKNSRERILIKNSLVIKGSVDSNTEISVFLCIILRVCVVNPKLVEGLPQKHRGTGLSFAFAVFSNHESSNPWPLLRTSWE